MDQQRIRQLHADAWVSTMKICAVVIVAALTATGCATPPGQLKDSDFVIRSVQSNKPVPELFSAFYEGVRLCGARLGIADCAPIRPNGSAMCDMYTPDAFGGRSPWVLGRVDFIPTQTGSTVELRMQTYVNGNGRGLDLWEKAALGQSAEICPSE